MAKDWAFQSTHPRGVRRPVFYEALEAMAVSIHAPARGATYEGSGRVVHIFRFNPRTREGCD